MAGPSRRALSPSRTGLPPNDRLRSSRTIAEVESSNDGDDSGVRPWRVRTVRNMYDRRWLFAVMKIRTRPNRKEEEPWETTTW